MRTLNLTMAVIVMVTAAATASAAPTLTSSGYAQNFNSMGTGTSYPDGWSGRSISGGHNDFTPADDPSSTGILPSASTTMSDGSSASITAGTPGTQKGANAYNWAVGGSSSERSLGTSPSGNAGTILQLQMVNGTGAPINMIDIAYDIRVFSTTTNNNNYTNPPYTGKEELPGYWLFYSLDGSHYTNISDLNGDGHTWANAVGTVNESVSDYVLSSAWASGATITFRWFDDNAQGPSPDQLIGLDNLSISAAPEPATLSLLALGGGLALLRRRNKKA